MRFEILLALSFLAVIIAFIACSPPRKPKPTLSSTLFPTVMLTTYNPQFATRISSDALPAATILPAAVGFEGLRISPPRCYEPGGRRVTCLGTVRNQTNGAVGDISLQVRYLGMDGSLQGQELLTLEQHRVGQDERAAYRIQVPNGGLETDYLEIKVASAQLSAQPNLALSLTDMQASHHPDDGRYLLTAQLENTTALDARDARLIVTLENEDGAIIGYRAADLPQVIPSGARLPIRLSIVPLEAAAKMLHRVALQAFPAASRPRRVKRWPGQSDR